MVLQMMQAMQAAVAAHGHGGGAVGGVCTSGNCPAAQGAASAPTAALAGGAAAAPLAAAAAPRVLDVLRFANESRELLTLRDNGMISSTEYDLNLQILKEQCGMRTALPQ